MTDFKKLEQDVEAVMHKLLGEAEAAEPSIEDAVGNALVDAGVPAPLVTVVHDLIVGLQSHFSSEKSAQPVNEPLPEPEQKNEGSWPAS
jgi:hypothetical protein